uniref:LY6/PLAUR domain containing 3 n=1 Tax=Chelonoidis abingdonii TaxID=106734 RepID=A0A8C0H8Y4_CHEAB
WTQGSVPSCTPISWMSGLFLPPHAGATALECHSCVERSDGGCSPEKMKTISCPDNTQLCMETVAAVKWSHGQFLVGEKGCGLGRPGTNDKGVDLHGIFAFSQVHNCNSSRCNSRLDIQAMALQPMGNESARVPNGLECYSCQGNEACSPDNATVVKCYDGYQGCFHGNVTMRVGNFSLSHPIKGCVQNKDCTKEARGSAAVNLVGSCCSGHLCNRDLANKTFFAPNIPRLEVMPGPGANTTGANATATATVTAMVDAASTVAAATTVTAAATPLPLDHGDHEDHEDHEDHDDLIRDDRHVTTAGERRNNPGIKLPSGGKGGAAGLSASAWLVLLGSALLL